jgi:hypothetical protein
MTDWQKSTQAIHRNKLGRSGPQAGQPNRKRPKLRAEVLAENIDIERHLQGH